MNSPTHPFHVFTTLGKAWHNVKGAKGAIWLTKLTMLGVGLAAFLVTLIVNLIFQIPTHDVGANQPAPQLIIHWVFDIVLLFLLAPLAAGILMVGVKRARGEPVKLSTPFGYWSRWWALGRALIYSVIVLIVILIPFIVLTMLAVKLGNIFVITHAANGNGHTIINFSSDIQMGGFIFSLVMVFLTFLVMTYGGFMILFSLLNVADRNIKPLRAVGHAIALIFHHVFRILGLALMLMLFGFLLALPFIISISLGSIILITLAVIFYIVCYVWFLPYIYMVYGLTYTELER